MDDFYNTVQVAIDKRTYRRALAVADDMGLTVAEVVKRAIDVIVMARGIAKGHEIDRRNAAEKDGE